MDGFNPCPTEVGLYTEDTLKSEHKAMFSYRTMRLRGRGRSIYKAKAEAVIFGLEAQAILRT